MKILLVRYGAFGDNVIITPLIRYLKHKGHDIYVLTNERGMQVFKGNPHITKLIEQKTDSVPNNKLSEHIEKVRKEHGCEKVHDLSESIEVALSQHPRSPNYKLPKQERFKKFNRNFYEYTFEHAGYDWTGVNLKPELFFEESELNEASKYIKPDCFNLLIGMAGSGGNKAWPYTEQLCDMLRSAIDNLHIITVGDERCQMIEPQAPHITNLSGKIPMRLSMALTSLADAVVCPDTGLLHASGCYPTPKVGLLGHNTREVITKYFQADYSVEADPKLSPCAPCFYLVYDIELQCPIDHPTGAVYCMGKGIPVEPVFNRIMEAFNVINSDS